MRGARRMSHRQRWIMVALAGIGVVLACFTTMMYGPYLAWARNLKGQQRWNFQEMMEKPTFFFRNIPNPVSWENPER